MKESQGDKETIGFGRALTDPNYKMATMICIAMSIANQMTGINGINIYATKIYQDIQD